jgi:4-amino-4-deoxy-L-arabinose transferase-like glycosyltransferase
MVDHPADPTLTDPPPVRLSTAYAIALGLAILVHVVLLAWMLNRIVLATNVTEPSVKDLAFVVPVCFIVFAALLARFRTHCWAVLIVACTVVAGALLTPLAVVTVGLMIMNAYLIGDRLLAWVASRSDDAQSARHPASIAVLTGVCLWIGLLAVTAPFEIHYAPVYALLLVLPFVAFRERTRQILVALGRKLVQRATATTITEYGWAVLLGTVVVLHLLVVAKPEAGYDALSIHLQFAQMLAAHHAWPFDVERYVWAVMPLGTDFEFANAYLLGGESAARLLNLAFGIVVCHLMYRLIRLYARREIALASVCVVAAMPLAFLLTGWLFSETLQFAYLLAALLLFLEYAQKPAAATIAAFLLACAGAMQCKLISAFWIGPLLLYMAYLLWRRRDPRTLTPVMAVVALIAFAIAVFPYANAWMRTGNPVFPFMNDVFRSPLFDVSASFNNPHYDAPLRIWSPYELILSSGRFIEGQDGAAGFHWLLLFPIVAFGFFRRRPAVQWLCLALATIFFVGVFTQQAYLRYLLPALLLVAILGGWMLSDLPDRPVMRGVLLTAGTILVLLNLRFIYTASWTNTTLCLNCAFDSSARAVYLATFAPLRVIGDYLNRTLPEGRVGFFILNEMSPVGYVGYSRSGNWHDYETYRALVAAQSAEDVLNIARRYRLTHAVVLDAATAPDTDPVGAFRDRYTTPIWRFRGLAVVAIQSDAPTAKSAD